MDAGKTLERYRPAVVSRSAGCGGATDVGRVRVRNEDAFWIAADGSALAVADGLGGLPAGHVASALAMAGIEDFFATRPAPASQAAPDDDALVALAVEAAGHAQHAVLAASREVPQAGGMATTLVLVVIRGRKAVVLHVGDSRAALWRSGGFVAMTADQNGAGELIRSGLLTAAQARQHPSRYMVHQVIGTQEGYVPECEVWNLLPGDVVVLFTDGVTEALGDDEITEVLATRTAAASAASSLVTLAALRGGSDNATAVVRCVT
ncbi:MAG TPA: protein phosphatase 2C domain-containing protein [Candidatus Binatia bacterium]